MTNDARYAASGTAHKSGAGAIVVVTCAVTATSCADGIAASTTHRARFDHAIGDPRGVLGTAASVPCLGITTAHARTSAASTAKATRSARDWSPRSNDGSM